MGVVLRNVYEVKGRWKYRKVVPARLRPYVDGKITEFVRWLGPVDGKPGPEILRKSAEADTECSRLLTLAEKRCSGQFDEIGQEAIAHIIAQARHDMLDEDEEERFDPSEDSLFGSVAAQLEGTGVAINPSNDRRWEKRQESLEATLAVWRHEFSRGQISDFVADEVADRCAANGLHVDTGSLDFRRLAKAYLALLIEVAEAGLARQRGDVIETPAPPSVAAIKSGSGSQTITGLVEDWWREAYAAGRSQSTYDAYARAARQFIEFLGHDDANAVTKENVIHFKDFRLGQGKDPKTVKAGDLAGLGALFSWGVANDRVRHNPVLGVKVLVPRKAKERGSDYTDEEAAKLLAHAAAYRKSASERETTAAAKRWVPWLCAYTGARLGEIVQLRRKDVVRRGSVWAVVLTPEAGTIKTKQFREVPLHPHLVDEGFLDFVEQAPEGYLFMKIANPGDKGTRGAWRTAKNDVTEFVRKVITDPRVQPSHGWRHRVETQARLLGVRDDITYAVTGRTMRGSAAGYGVVPLEAKVEFINRLPRIKARSAHD